MPRSRPRSRQRHLLYLTLACRVIVELSARPSRTQPEMRYLLRALRGLFFAML